MKNILILTIIIFSGCSDGDSFKVPELPAAVNPVNVSFSYTTPAPTEILIIDLSNSIPEEVITYHIPLEEGANTLTLDKGTNYSIGLAALPEESDTEDSVRSISSAVMGLGNFQIIAASLDSIPIEETLGENLDLGTLTETENSFTSDISSDTASSALGYETTVLEDFGSFDLANRQLMNPDINRDGYIDSDRGCYWRLMTLVDRIIENSDFDIASETAPLALTMDEFAAFNLRYAFRLDNFSEISIFMDAAIYLTFTDPDTGDEVVLNYGQFEELQGDAVMIYFGIPSEYHFLPGDYTLRADDQDLFFFTNLQFLTPETNYEGFIFPISEARTDGEGNWESLSWRWLQIRGGEFQDVSDPEVVRLAIRTMYFYFWINETGSETYGPDHFGSEYHYYENGTIDLTGYNFTNGPVNDINGTNVATDFWDSGDNDYSFAYEVIQ